jgi:hypothetical protein
VEQNPYESPTTPEAMTTGKVVKRGLGVGAILLLTPVAVGIAFGGSCAATNLVLAVLSDNQLGLSTVIGIGLAVFLIPPAAVLVAMLGWAIRTHRKNKNANRA